jgi:membrane protein
MPLPPLVLDLWRFAGTVVRRFQEDRCTRVAGALSFTTVLALVPLTAVALAVLSIFPAFKSWMTVIQDFIYANFVPAFGEVVQRHMQQFALKAGRLTAIGVLFLAVTAILLMATIEQAFNDIWRVKNTRRPLHRFLIYWAILTLGPLLIGLALSLTSALFSLSLFAGRGLLHGVRGGLLMGLPFFLELAAFWLLYSVVPNAGVRWRHALIGALFAALLFEVAQQSFATFVYQVAAYQAVYGAVAALPVFLVWIYLSWVVILLGAVVTAALPQWRAPAPA